MRNPIPSNLLKLLIVIGTLRNYDDDGSENIVSNFIYIYIARLFGTAQFVQCRRQFLEVNSLGLYPCSNRERKICCRMSTSSTKRRIGRFHIVVVQWTSVDLQSCCFAHKTNCFFLRCRCRCRCRCCCRRRRRRRRFLRSLLASVPDAYLLP